ncbi:MAG TPA: molybdopterin dinucleotide-binding protein [Gammaproteobacteria bacterium]|nr:molybdopterin dinucleotide-binding protein [Gammaproteobacteria bacterium]
MSVKMNRRSFMKMMGWGGAGTLLAGCDMPSTVTLEEGREEVISYLSPEEYVIPGVGVWYASTCTQCAAGCGIHGRVREGRVLKLEGNPASPVNRGKLCLMGQAGVQNHYNPDRVTTPLLRSGGSLSPVSWEKAEQVLAEKLGGVTSGRFAWFTGSMSGHQLSLVSSHLDAMGSDKHFVHEVVNNSVAQAVYADMFGDASPRLRIDKARMVLSFGADFMGTSESPLLYSGDYTRFRTGDTRGLLVQVEPKMSLTGGSADLWMPIRPGTEGVLALGIANLLLNKLKMSDAGIPADVRAMINDYDVTSVARITGVAGHRIQRVAALLQERSPSLVLAGAAVEGHTHGYASTAAVMMINHILGNVGRTIEPGARMPFPQLAAKRGGTSDLVAFAEAARGQQLDAVIFHASNPVYTAPASLGLEEGLANIAFKVAIAQFPDETAMAADLVLPAASYLEDWGTQAPAFLGGGAALQMQQPLMEKLHAETRGFGDIVLTLLKQRRDAGFEAFEDYYGYLRNAFAALPASVKDGTASDEAFWNGALQTGVVMLPVDVAPLKSTVVAFDPPRGGNDAADGLTLIPSPRMGLWDGRHANLPWLQEAPDQISKVVWDSWAEIHPETAQKNGISQGDLISVSSAHGEIRTRAVLLKSMHRDAVAVPLGQGHEAYGRYAKGVGVNPLKIIDPARDEKTGELAMYATRVSIKRIAGPEQFGLVKAGGSDTQAGRRLVVTVPAEQLRRTEGA